MPDEERQGVCAQVAASTAGSLLNTREQELLHWRGWRRWQRKTHLLCRAAQVVLLHVIVMGLQEECDRNSCPVFGINSSHGNRSCCTGGDGCCWQRETHLLRRTAQIILLQTVVAAQHLGMHAPACAIIRERSDWGEASTE